MTPDRWEQVQALFYNALAQPPEARVAFLDTACAADAGLREEVESLLAADAEADAAAFLAALPDLLGLE